MKYFLLTKLLLLSVFSFCQSTITARVVDKTNQAPIDNANIVLFGTPLGSKSNYLGYFQLEAKSGDKLIISHPSYVTSEIIVPESDAFLILLDRKYHKLGDISIDQFPINVDQTKLIIENEIKETEDFAKYSLGWQRFYIDLGNSIVKHPSFNKLDNSFDLNLMFTVTDKGNINEVNLLKEDAPNSDSVTNAYLIKSSLKQMANWIPASIEGTTINQFFHLNISRNKEIYSIVEEPAMPIGGFQSFYNYISSNLRYPSEAKESGIEGKVMIQFVVNKDGELTEIEVVKGIGAGCDKEAIRLIENSPHWYPPYQRGKPVKQRIMLPITFNPDTNNPKKRISFNDYISSRIRYPRKAREMNIEGTAYISFQINEVNNQIFNITLLNDIESDFFIEIESVLKSVPEEFYDRNFKPSEVYILPINFKLNEYKKDAHPSDFSSGVLLEEVVVIAKDSYIPPIQTLSLNAGSQEYMSVDQALLNNPNTRRLSLTNKGIATLSTKINEFKKLVFLDLEGNNLSSLPNEITQLDKLEELYLINNNIASLPEEFYLLSSLKILGLAYNKLSEFPKQLTRLSKLEALDLSGNNISSIPAEIINLKKLKVLILNDNKISELPLEVYDLKHLERIFLINNELNENQIQIIKDKFRKTKVITE